MVHIAGVAAAVHIVGIVAHTAYTLVIGISHVLESFLKLTTNPHYFFVASYWVFNRVYTRHVYWLTSSLL